MRQLAIVIAIAALPALASAQAEEEGPEGDVVFVDSSEVEIVVEEEDPGTPFVEHEETPPPNQGQALPPPQQQQQQQQANLNVPAPPNVQLDQRALLQQRLAEHPLGGPIVMLAVGIPVAGIFGYAAYLAWHVEDGVCSLSGSCGEPNRTATAVLGTLAGAGLVLGTVGLISLIIRVGKRGRIRAQYSRGELADLASGTIRF